MANRDSRYNVICPFHGRVQIGQAGYDLQMSFPDERWRCPKCGRISDFDDDSYEASLEAEDNERQCFTCGRTLPEGSNALQCGICVRLERADENFRLKLYEDSLEPLMPWHRARVSRAEAGYLGGR